MVSKTCVLNAYHVAKMFWSESSTRGSRSIDKNEFLGYSSVGEIEVKSRQFMVMACFPRSLIADCDHSQSIYEGQRVNLGSSYHFFLLSTIYLIAGFRPNLFFFSLLLLSCFDIFQGLLKVTTLTFVLLLPLIVC